LPGIGIISLGMDNAPPSDDRAPTTGVESAEEAQRRLAWEAERIAEADADIAAGRLVDSAEIDAWIDSIGTDHELPPPSSGR
jgi:predicted transcriptional regulator